MLVVGEHGQLARELRRRSPDSTFLGRPALDLTDREGVWRAVHGNDWGVVINAGAYTAVDQAESEPELAFAVNRDGPACLAKACAAKGLPLIHISTDYVFDGTKPTAYIESDPVSPINVYGRSKAEGEEAVRTLHCDHIILRVAWVYSPFGHNFLKTMLRSGAERDVLRVVADQYGTPTSAGAIAEAILAVAPRAAAREAAGTFHFVLEGESTWHGFAEAIFDAAAALTGRRPRVDAITTADYPTPARRPANSRLDSRLFDRTFAYCRPHWRDMVAPVVREVLAGCNRSHPPSSGTGQRFGCRPESCGRHEGM